MDMITAQALQQACFTIAALSGALCIYSLVMWPVRERLARLEAKRAARR